MLLTKPTKLYLHLRRSYLLSHGRGSSAELRPREHPRCGSVPASLLRSLPLAHFHRFDAQIPVPSLLFRALQETPWTRLAKGFCSLDDGDGEARTETKYGDDVVFSTCGVDPKEIETVCQVIEEMFPQDGDMESALNRAEIRLSTDLVVEVLGRFKRSRRPAFRFFCWAGRRPDFAHNIRTYNAMVSILAKTRQYETMLTVLEEMGEKRILSLSTFHIASRTFAAAKEGKKALAVFELMGKHGFELHVGNLNSLLESLCRAKLAKEAQALFDRFRKRFPPNLYTYTVLLNGWCTVGNLVEAGRVWNEMSESGFPPDAVAYNIMIQCMLGSKMKFDAIELYQLMTTRGPAPTIRTYMIMIRDSCKQRRLYEARQYLKHMVKSGIKPDIAVYTCLIMGHGMHGERREVHKFLNEMEAAGLVPDSHFYNSMISLMVRRERPVEAARVYKEMVLCGVLPSVHTYNMMMKGFFVVGDYERGRAVWGEMAKRRLCCPDEITYTILIGGLVKEGRVDEACKYLEEMLEKGMKAPALDYTRLATSLSRLGSIDMLGEMARKMMSAGEFSVSCVFVQWADKVNLKKDEIKKKIRR